MRKYEPTDELLDILYDELNKFVEIPAAEWELYRSAAFAMDFEKNEFFIKAGERPDKMAFIMKGLFRVYTITESGNEVTLVFRDENKFLSAYSSYLENQKAGYYIQSIEESTVLYMDLSRYMKLANGHDCWKSIITQYSQRLFIEKEKREAELLGCNATERYQNFITANTNMADRIPKRYMASYLGITPETLSRIINR